MQALELKIVKIGNSRGIRIPIGALRRYAFTEVAIMVENVDGILLRPKRQADVKLSWADTAKAMAASSEDWADWETTAADGLDSTPWVAEKRNVWHASQNRTTVSPPSRKKPRKKT